MPRPALREIDTALLLKSQMMCIKVRDIASAVQRAVQDGERQSSLSSSLENLPRKRDAISVAAAIVAISRTRLAAAAVG